jgi:hypothetical protein
MLKRKGWLYIVSLIAMVAILMAWLLVNRIYSNTGKDLTMTQPSPGQEYIDLEKKIMVNKPVIEASFDVIADHYAASGDLAYLVINGHRIEKQNEEIEEGDLLKNKAYLLNKDLQEVWSFKSPEGVIDDVAISYHGNYISVLTVKYLSEDEIYSYLYYLDNKGRLLWKKPAMGYVEISENGDFVLVGGYVETKLYDKEGKLLFELDQAAPSMSRNGEYVVNDNRAYTHKGKYALSQDINENIFIKQVSPRGNYFLGMTEDKEIVLVDKNSKILWKRSDSRLSRPDKLFFSPDEKYIVGYSDRYQGFPTVYLLDINGDLVWERKFKEGKIVSAGPLAFSQKADFIIVNLGVKSEGDRLYCLDKEGKVLWRTDPFPIRNFFVAGDGESILAVSDKKIYKFKNIAIK